MKVIIALEKRSNRWRKNITRNSFKINGCLCVHYMGMIAVLKEWINDVYQINYVVRKEDIDHIGKEGQNICLHV